MTDYIRSVLSFASKKNLNDNSLPEEACPKKDMYNLYIRKYKNTKNYDCHQIPNSFAEVEKTVNTVGIGEKDWNLLLESRFARCAISDPSFKEEGMRCLSDRVANGVLEGNLLPMKEKDALQKMAWLLFSPSRKKVNISMVCQAIQQNREERGLASGFEQVKSELKGVPNAEIRKKIKVENSIYKKFLMIELIKERDFIRERDFIDDFSKNTIYDLKEQNISNPIEFRRRYSRVVFFFKPLLSLINECHHKAYPFDRLYMVFHVSTLIRLIKEDRLKRESNGEDLTKIPMNLKFDQSKDHAKDHDIELAIVMCISGISSSQNKKEGDTAISEKRINIDQILQNRSC